MKLTESSNTAKRCASTRHSLVQKTPQTSSTLASRKATPRAPEDTLVARAGLSEPEQESCVRAADGTQLHASRTGQGPAVILCDALGCDGFAWPNLKAKLADRYTVITWHYRGHGRSEGVKPGDNMDTLTNDLESVLDHYKLPKVTLLGYSLGANIALRFALKRPERVNRLISLCGNSGGKLALLRSTSPVRWALAGIFAVERVLRALPPVGPWLWRHFVGNVVYGLAVSLVVRGNQANPGDFKPYFSHLGKMDARVFAQFLECMQQESLDERLPAVTAPTLLIAGSNDVMAPPSLSQRMHSQLPRSELCILPGASHLLPLERQDDIGTHIEHFLTALSP